MGHNCTFVTRDCFHTTHINLIRLLYTCNIDWSRFTVDRKEGCCWQDNLNPCRNLCKGGRNSEFVKLVITALEENSQLAAGQWLTVDHYLYQTATTNVTVTKSCQLLGASKKAHVFNKLVDDKRQEKQSWGFETFLTLESVYDNAQYVPNNHSLTKIQLNTLLTCCITFQISEKQWI